MEEGAGGWALGARRRAKAKDFSELEVWRAGRVIANDVYRITRAFPVEEQFGLTSQMRRSVVAISSNIAEGFNRRGGREFQRFVSIAMGSCAELRSLLSSRRISALSRPKRLSN